MKKKSSNETTQIMWLTDLHLDRANTEQINLLLLQLTGTIYDAVAISGDISTAPYLERHLWMIAQACAPRPVFFVIGNHDYYYSSIKEVEDNVTALCEKVKNLHYVDGSKIIHLGRGIALTGHGGWADARAGEGSESMIDNPDRDKISDLHNLSRTQIFDKMRELGKLSARMIRRTLPLALTRYRHVIVLTHVPPYPEVVLHRNEPCDKSRLPHFVNLSVGLMIRAILKAFPHRKVTVLAGHSHGFATAEISNNLSVHVGGARTGRPVIQGVLEF